VVAGVVVVGGVGADDVGGEGVELGGVEDEVDALALGGALEAVEEASSGATSGWVSR
jgi:hypothetical protein